MSNDWKWLYETTQSMASKLELDQVSLDELIEYLEQREKVMSSLQEQGVPHEQIKRSFNFVNFNKWDQVILSKMTLLYKEASDELGKLSARKLMKTGYEAQSTQSSFFFDSKN